MSSLAMRGNSAQGTRNNSFQFPVSGAIVPSSLQQSEFSNNGSDKYLGVGKVRASSAHGGKRQIRDSLDLTNMIIAAKLNQPIIDDSPRVQGAAVTPSGRPMSAYEQMKANAQRINHLNEFMANRPPSGARNIASAGGVNPRLQNQHLVNNPSAFHGYGYAGNSGNTAQLYHIMGTSAAAAAAAASNSSPTPASMMSSSMPVTGSALRPSSASPAIARVGSGDSAEVCSILSTSSSSRKGAAKSNGIILAKKKVRFAEKLTSHAPDTTTLLVTPPPYLGTPPVASKKAQLMEALNSAADAQYTANLATGLLSFLDHASAGVPLSIAERKENASPMTTAPHTANPPPNKLPQISAPIPKKAVASTVAPTTVTARSPSPTVVDSSDPQTSSPEQPPPQPLVKESLGPVAIPAATSGAFYLSQPVATTNGAASPTPIRAPSPSTVVPSANGKKKPVRPSLSEQLASIGAKAEAITTDIRVKAKMDVGPAAGGAASGDAALFSMPARCLTIGSLSCRFPSPIHFFSDRCEYIFNHPFEASVINMIIYYRDMTAISILGTKLKFKLPKKMACFLADFDPQNPHHIISVEMSSMLSISMIREKVLPLISSFK